MWDEIRGYLIAFVVIPLALGALWACGYRFVTGEWPDVPRAECVTDWDGVSNPTICD